MLPIIKIKNLEVTRLIVGGNPFSGNSHVDGETNDEMESFFSTEKIKETLFRCAENGINTMQMRGDTHIQRIVREFRESGGSLNWIAQTASELSSFEGSINRLLRFKIAAPDAIYLHGSATDAFFKANETGEITRRLKILRETGLPVGLATHMPEIIENSEENNWDVDFYMACVYNLSRADRISSAITGVDNSGEPFFDEDIPVMYDRIRKTSKPCLAFKILGASRRCGTQDDVRFAFKEAFLNIKPTDGVIVGMFPKKRDEVQLNASYVREALGII